MCIITVKFPIRKIAEEDIVVYKKVDIIQRKYLFGLFKEIYLRSEIKRFKYKLNKTYKTFLSRFIAFDNRYYSGSGFYSYADKQNYCNVKCIIPKGSWYYLCVDVNNFFVETYLSDKIKIVEII